MLDIGRHIAKSRKAKGLTQADLAEQLHVTRQAVSSWETGRTLPDLPTIVQIAECLNVSAEKLIYGKEISVKQRDTSAYRTAAKTSAVVVLVSVCCALLVRGLIGRPDLSYTDFAEFLYRILLCPMAFFSGAFCFMSLLSLRADLFLPIRWLRLTLQVLGIVCLGMFLYTSLVVYTTLPGGMWAYRVWLWLAFHSYVFVLPGIALFLGFDRPL